MDFDVQCATTAILNRGLPALADRICGDLEHAGRVRHASIVSNVLTRRLTLTARGEAGTSQTAITVVQDALLAHLREHGPEYWRVAIQHADATPAV